ncbi:MAG: polyprenyl diphosphate synthase [Leptospirales bacterium]
MPLNEACIPKHLAIIMDGNGRWAQDRGLSRLDGHKHGADILDRLLDTILELKIPYVSLYAFSTENWKRPKTEVTALFELLNRYLKDRLNKMVEKGICMRVSGDIQGLPFISRNLVNGALERTRNGTNLVANFCINYGSRDEIVHAVESLIAERSSHKVKKSANLTWEDIDSFLYTSGMPGVDLLIRTGGEKRLSNFLLLQSAYAEIYFTETLWPEFNEKELLEILQWYQSRVRKFGGLENSEKVKTV